MNADLAAISVTGLRQAFYRRISAKNLTPLWEVLDALVPSSPRPTVIPAIWRFADIHKDVLEAGALISAKEAERRVLILENPAARGLSCITQSLYAGLQLILPGEVAPAHRHAQSALRLLLDGEGAYTAVDGERTIMRRGDFIITPSRTWHDHGNTGSSPVTWLDGLDIPLVKFLDAGFAEKGGEESQPETRVEGDTLVRYGSNMLPVDYEPSAREPTRLFVYPYTQTRAALMGVAKDRIDPFLGYKLKYVNPATGGPPMLTIGAFAQYLPSGFQSKCYRSTDSTIYVCLEGSGAVKIGADEFKFDVNDVFVAPSWASISFCATENTILFSFSDRPVQKALGLWREERVSR